MPQPRTITKEEMERCFDGAAATYDTMGGSPFASWGDRLVTHLGLRDGEQVLDIATGTGAALLPAARAVGGTGHVTGTDLSASMVEQAAANARAAGLTNVTVQQCDAEHLPFDDAAFDAVTCAFSLFMFHDQAAALAEMRRVCRPGGRIGFSLFARSPAPFEPGWQLFGQQALEWGVATRMPQRVAFEPEEAAAMLREHGLAATTVAKEVYDVVFPTPEAWWSFQLTLGSRSTIMGMDEATRARFREEHFGQLRAVQRPDGLHMAAAVVYVVCSAG